MWRFAPNAVPQEHEKAIFEFPTMWYPHYMYLMCLNDRMADNCSSANGCQHMWVFRCRHAHCFGDCCHKRFRQSVTLMTAIRR
jgi:hypothetical protein